MAKPKQHKCKWVPVSFAFETQLLGPRGEVQIRQPNIDKGRVYVVCMGCHAHSYIETRWAGYYLAPGDL